MKKSASEECETCTEEKSEPEVEKADMGVMMMPFGGATSWEQYDGYIAQQKASQTIYDSWYTMETLAQNVMMDDNCADKKKAMAELLSGCKKRMEMKSLIVLSKLENFDPAAVVKSEAPAQPPAHPLDDQIGQLKATYDQLIASEGTSQEKLQAIQPVFAQLGEAVKVGVEQSEVKIDPAAGDASPDHMLQELSQSVKALRDEVTLLTSQLSAKASVQQVSRPAQPPHRNLGADATIVKSVQSLTAEKPGSLKSIIRKSVGLQY